MSNAIAADRFWPKVLKDPNPDGCWLWLGATSVGYGMFRHGSGRMGKVGSAHRFSWELAHGPIPDGLAVCHRCDTPACVNPAHLFLGSQAENMRDCTRKGRNFKPQGQLHPRAKLTDSDVQAIRRSWEGGGVTQPALAAQFGVALRTLQAVIYRETWRHLS